MISRFCRVSAGGLAGWLFADLALVLSFVFLDSTSFGEGADKAGAKAQTTTTSTTSTAPVDSKGSGGARPQPIKVEFPAAGLSSTDDLVRAVDAEVARSDSSDKDSKTFLVVIVHGGSGGSTRPRGIAFAQNIASRLEKNWERVIAGTTYFETGDDSGIPYGTVRLKLFPVSASGR